MFIYTNWPFMVSLTAKKKQCIAVRDIALCMQVFHWHKRAYGLSNTPMSHAYNYMYYLMTK